MKKKTKPTVHKPGVEIDSHERVNARAESNVLAFPQSAPRVTASAPQSALEAALTPLVESVADEHKLLDSIRAAHQKFIRTMVDAWNQARPLAIDIGRSLIELRSRREYGQWEAFVEKQLPFGVREAQRYMAVARKAPEALPSPNTKANATRVSHLSLRGLQAMVATPKSDPTVHPVKNRSRERVITTAQHGVTKFISLAWDLLQRLDPEMFEAQVAGELRKLLAEAQERLDRARAVKDSGDDGS